MMYKAVSKLISVVGAGDVAFLPIGQAGVLKALGLTRCTAILLRALDDKGACQGYLMGHRQPGDTVFINSLKTKVKALPPFKWQLVAVQHAPQISYPGEIETSLAGIADDVESVCAVSSSDINRRAERAPDASYDVGQMIVEIDQSGKETVQRREGIFTKCIIM